MLTRNVSGGIRLVHVQFRQADLAPLLEELDAQPVGGDRLKRPHALDKAVAGELEHAQHLRLIGVHGFLRIADAGGSEGGGLALQ